jgi:hypothetical protein
MAIMTRLDLRACATTARSYKLVLNSTRVTYTIPNRLLLNGTSLSRAEMVIARRYL